MVFKLLKIKILFIIFLYPSFALANSCEDTFKEDEISRIIEQFTTTEEMYITAKPGFLPVKNKEFALEAMNDFFKYSVISEQDPNSSLLEKYKEFGRVLNLLSSPTGRSRTRSETLAKYIVNLEKSERDYSFQEYKIINFNFFKKDFISEQKKVGIEEEVLETYDEFMDYIKPKLIQGRLSPKEANKVNLYAHIGWKANKEEVHRLLQTLYDKNGRIGSYYYALSSVEDFFEDKGNVQWLIDILTKSQEILFSSVLESNSSLQREYYTDKWVKILLVQAYVYYELFLKESDRYATLKLDDNKEKEICIQDCTNAREDSYEFIFYYLVLSKYSGAEDIFKEKYKLTSEGFFLDVPEESTKNN